jgi:hypothetical protein
MPRPTKPTTPEQWNVISWTAIAIFAAMGTAGLWVWLRAPAAKAEEARQLLWLSLTSWLLTAVVYAGKRLVARIFD